MALRILLTVLYWLYAFIVLALSFVFVGNAPIGQTENRTRLAVGLDIFVFGMGLALTALIWTVGS